MHGREPYGRDKLSRQDRAGDTPSKHPGRSGGYPGRRLALKTRSIELEAAQAAHRLRKSAHLSGRAAAFFAVLLVAPLDASGEWICSRTAKGAARLHPPIHASSQNR